MYRRWAQLMAAENWRALPCLVYAGAWLILHGSLPRQFGGVLPGLSGSFAACGTRSVCTAARY